MANPGKPRIREPSFGFFLWALGVMVSLVVATATYFSLS
jgi:hypothetical protein